MATIWPTKIVLALWIYYGWLMPLGYFQAAPSLCVDEYKSQDVGGSIKEISIQPTSSAAICLLICYRQSPCKSAVYVKPSSPMRRGMCKLYGKSAKGDLVDVDAELNDATYYELLDKCPEGDQTQGDTTQRDDTLVPKKTLEGDFKSQSNPSSDFVAQAPTYPQSGGGGQYGGGGSSYIRPQPAPSPYVPPQTYQPAPQPYRPAPQPRPYVQPQTYQPAPQPQPKPYVPPQTYPAPQPRPPTYQPAPAPYVPPQPAPQPYVPPQPAPAPYVPPQPAPQPYVPPQPAPQPQPYVPPQTYQPQPQPQPQPRPYIPPNPQTYYNPGFQEFYKMRAKQE